jgi:uncharacterized Ntn-hydrolase superfamily protein
MTFSITAKCSTTGDLGIAISTAVPAVGRRCPFVKYGVGAIATQSFTNVRLGETGLRLLELGLTPEHAIEILLEEEGRELRQAAAVNAQGRVFAYTGSKCVGWAGHVVGEGFAVAGNMLVGPQVVREMKRAFESSSGELSERLLLALEAGQAAGGDRRGRQSAALLVGSKEDRLYHNLRVDDHPDPVAELRRVHGVAVRRTEGRRRSSRLRGGADPQAPEREPWSARPGPRSARARPHRGRCPPACSALGQWSAFSPDSP